MTAEIDNKLRALDEVPAPDQWNEVARRAEGPEMHILEPEAPRSHTRLLVAAVVVLVLAIGAGVVATTRIDDTAEVATHDGSATVTTDPPDQIWGRKWFIERLTTVEGDTPIPEIRLRSGDPDLDLSATGIVHVAACNAVSYPGELQDDRLGIGPPGISTAMACANDVESFDRAVGLVLSSRPHVELRGDHLTFRTDTTTIELVDAAVVTERDAVDQIWGRRWVVTSIITGTGAIDVPTSHPPVLALTEPGRLWLESCPIYNGDAHIDGVRLMASHVTDAGHDCFFAPPYDVNRAIIDTLMGGPAIDLRDDELRLTLGATVLTLGAEH